MHELDLKSLKILVEQLLTYEIFRSVSNDNFWLLKFKQVKLDPKLNEYVGFSLPRNGVPKKCSFPASTRNALIKYLESAEKSSYLYVNMAVVLDNHIKVPSFSETSEAFCTDKMQSQTCDQMFRRLRSMTTTEMIVTNFDTKDALSHLHRINLMEESELFVQENGFVIPRKSPCTSTSTLVEEEESLIINHLKHFSVDIIDKNLSCQVNHVPNLVKNLKNNNNR